MFVINQCDHEKADFDTSLEQAKARFGNKLIAFQYPLNPGKILMPSSMHCAW